MFYLDCLKNITVDKMQNINGHLLAPVKHTTFQQNPNISANKAWVLLLNNIKDL